MENGINDKEVNLENTNKHTKIQKLFKNDFFQIYFFVFLVLFFLDNYQILFSSIESVFFIFDIDDYKNKIGLVSVENGYKSNIVLSFFNFFDSAIFFAGSKTLEDQYSDDGWGIIAIGFILCMLLLIILILFSAIIAFKQIKSYIVKNTKFNFLFYILFFICIYSICIILAINTIFTPFGHMFMIKDFNIEKMKICIIIAFCTTLAFKFLIHFKLKDKK